ncbi:MAG: MBL fold metallo-hydrolase [Ginsengibacter sp.]|jgi:glyoxylase-like metal-dependent hydrolase (beta-lactamase superfamily II)/rhodanese-related sulfurtransferase
MEIIQFEDINLAHYSYALISNGEAVLIDPARNPQQYYDVAKRNNAKIVAVIETHPHADFVSSHAEIHETTEAVIYVSRLLKADYEHHFFDDGDKIKIGGATLKALNTPGHSPDSICIIAINESGKEEAVFTGDTLFIGDCGRPDLRETAGGVTAAREELARQMYHSLRDKLMNLPDDVLVYPSHGAGSLCGKGLSSKNVSTIGAEKSTNWCLHKQTETDFISELLSNQPFVPKYFTFNVGLNKKGAKNYADSIRKIKTSENIPDVLKDYIVIDTRNESIFKNGHLKNSINLMDDTKFETWLGSVISPDEKFYLIAETKNAAKTLIERIAKIGYENQIEEAFAAKEIDGEKEEKVNLQKFKDSKLNYTIVDIRNNSEVKERRIFDNAIQIPLPELRERVSEIPTDKPIIVHCAGGYRSAAGATIIKEGINDVVPVFDLGYAIQEF